MLRFTGMFLCICGGLTATAEEPLSLHEFRETHLAVPVDFRVYATTEASANAAAKAAYARIDELNAIFSDYDSDSEASRLCKAVGPVKISPELFFVLNQSLAISQQTNGAFDVTVGPLIKQWRRARRQKMLPTPDQIATAQQLIGYKNLRLNEVDQTAQVLQPGMQLDFGGIAKGYVAEEAFKVLAAHGSPRSLVAVAGDIYAGEAPPDAPAWKIGIAPLDKPDGPPSRFVALKRQSASTSGDAFQYVEIGGVRYSHIVDPKTGLGLTHRSSVTIIAPHGWQADGYATAVCLLGPERGLKLVENMKEVEAMVVTGDDEGKTVTQQSPGFEKRLWQK